MKRPLLNRNASGDGSRRIGIKHPDGLAPFREPVGFVMLMGMPLQIKLLSSDETLVEALSTVPVDSLPGDAGVALKIGPPRFVPGAVGSWWEILGAIGVIGFPVGVVGNLVASWIWQAMTTTKAQRGLTSLNLDAARKVKLILRSGEQVIEADIESSDFEAIRVTVETALSHVDQHQ